MRVKHPIAKAKCFHVELAESPSRSKLVIWSRDIRAAAHSATIRWKHLGAYKLRDALVPAVASSLD